MNAVDLRGTVERTSDNLSRLPAQTTVIAIAQAADAETSWDGLAVRPRRIRTQDVHRNAKGASRDRGYPSWCLLF